MLDSRATNSTQAFGLLEPETSGLQYYEETRTVVLVSGEESHL